MISRFPLLAATLLVFALPELSMATDGESLWDWEGMPVMGSGSWTGSYTLLPDSAGGAVVVWTYSNKVRAQRLDANGNPLWGPDGVQVSDAANAAYGVGAKADWGMYGWLIVAWESGDRIYAQKLNENGQKQWNSGNGVQMFSTFVPDMPGPVICGDGIGGAYIGWRNRVAYIDSSGSLAGGGGN